MPKSIFSRTYIASIQSKIEQCINCGKLEEAFELLDGLKREQDPRLEVDRLVIQREGYRAIAQVCVIEYESQYTTLGTPEEIRTRLQELDDIKKVILP